MRIHETPREGVLPQGSYLRRKPHRSHAGWAPFAVAKAPPRKAGCLLGLLSVGLGEVAGCWLLSRVCGPVSVPIE